MDDIGAVKPLKLLKSKLLPETSLKKSVYKNFANFTEKHLCWSFFLNKISVNCKIFGNTSFEEHLRTTAFTLYPGAATGGVL